MLSNKEYWVVLSIPSNPIVQLLVTCIAHKTDVLCMLCVSSVCGEMVG